MTLVTTEAKAIPETRPGPSATEPNTSNTGNRHRGWQILVGLLLVIALVVAGVLLFNKPATPLDEAVSLIKSNRHAAALPLLEKLQKNEPDNDEVFAWLAQCYLRTDRLAEGRTALDTALKLKLNSSLTAPVVLAFADYYENKDDYAEAERLFASAQNSCKESDLKLGKAQLYARWADFNSNTEDHALALKHYEQAYGLMEESAPERARLPHRISEIYRRLAAKAQAENDEARAMDLLQSSLRWSDEAATRMALGNYYLRNNDTDKAIENFKMVAAQDANNLEARHRLIDLYMSTNNLQAAQQALLELTERERSVENFDQLASLNIKIGNYAGAVRALEDAIVLHPKDVNLLTELHDALVNWSSDLEKHEKIEEAASVKGHADRVADLLKEMAKLDEKPPVVEDAGTPPYAPGTPPVSLIASRIWLAKGSFTPEGEIRLKNISGKPVTDLALSVVFFDNTTKKTNGSIIVTAASETHPLAADAIQSVYFSCPNIVKSEHQLAVVIVWKGRLLKELPVVKER